MVLLIIGLILFIGLVILHEMGHFWVARRNGVEVEEFGIFFPPKLWGKKMKAGWDFTINLLPLGGFVKLKGEHDSDTHKGSFGAASDWAKTKIMLAGVAVNFVTAVVLFMILSWIGMPQLVEKQYNIPSDAQYVSRATYQLKIGSVVQDSPASQAGLRAGDTIVSIAPKGDTRPNKVWRASDFQKYTKQYNGREVSIAYTRDGSTQTVLARLHSEAEVAAAQKWGETIGRAGVSLAEERKGLDVVRSTWSAPVVALGTTAQFTALSFQGLGTALSGLGGILAGTVTGNTTARQQAQTEASSQVGGPLAIFFTLKEGAKLGFVFILMIIALISLTLAIMNVLPIPALDGGRLYMMLLSRLTKKKRLTAKMEENIVAGSFLFLIGLIILITIVDVKRFF